MTFLSHQSPIAFSIIPQTSSMINQIYGSMHQLRGGGSADDIILSFRDELAKMRQELEEEAELEMKVTRDQLRRKLGHGRQKEDSKPSNEDESDASLEDEEGDGNKEKDYEIYDEDEEIEDMLSDDLAYGYEEDEEEKEEDHLDWKQDEVELNNDIEYEYDDEEDWEKIIQQHADELTVEDDNSTKETADEMTLDDEDVIERLEDELSIEEEESQSQEDDVIEGRDGEVEDYEVATDIPLDIEEDIFEVGPSEEIDGNTEMESLEERKAPVSESISCKRFGKKRSKKQKKHPKRKKKKKRETNVSVGEVEEIYPDIDIEKDLVQQVQPKKESTFDLIIRTLVPTVIIALLLALTHFASESLLKKI